MTSRHCGRAEAAGPEFWQRLAASPARGDRRAAGLLPRLPVTGCAGVGLGGGQEGGTLEPGGDSRGSGGFQGSPCVFDPDFDTDFGW
jgi:hypothetical protein